MKKIFRISLLLVLGACFVPVAWAQQHSGMLSMGKLAKLRHQSMRVGQNSTLAASDQPFRVQRASVEKERVWELGTYPGGSWAELRSINNFGVAVGFGDIAGGDIRMIALPLFGPNAGKWFESGVSSDEDWNIEGGGISETGMIVGSVKADDGSARAYAWTPNHGGIDLGTLKGDSGSAAMAVNHLGTLIVGISYQDNGAAAVVWTPEIGWHQGKRTIAWKIHELPTGGMDQSDTVFPGVTLNWWIGLGVNDLGQIVGDGWSDNYDEIAVVWNPVHGGKGWEVQQLPHQSSSPSITDHYYTEALSINNRGEIVGDLSVLDSWWTDTGEYLNLPALWHMSPKTHTWKLTGLPTLSGISDGWNVAHSINDIGDVVGESQGLATRWLTEDPSSAKALGFPGDWSLAFQVNNFGIAVGSYGFGESPEQAVAVAIH